MLVLSWVLIMGHLFLLPGALVLLASPRRWQVSASGALAIPLSLGIAFYLTLALVASGQFTRPVLHWLILGEAIATTLLWWLARRRGTAPLSGISPWLVLAAFGAFAPALWSAVTHVFEQGDAVLSWNRWALGWAAGDLPRFTMSYPQLVPVTWANLYVALGLPAENLARALMPALAALATLLFAALAMHRRSLALALATVLTVLLSWRLLGLWLDEGYAETAVLFFATATLYPLLAMSTNCTREQCWWAVLTSLFLATATAHTKQGGLLVFLTHPLLVWLWLRDCPGWNQRAFRQYLGLTLLTGLVLVAPWYGFKHWQALSGQERDIAAYLIAPGGWHGQQTLVERVSVGFDRLGTAMGGATALVLAGALALAAFTRRYRVLLGVLLVPYVLVWAVTFNYDTRNLAAIVPLIALTAGHGLALLASRLVLGLRTPRWLATAVTPRVAAHRRLRYGLLTVGLLALGGLAINADQLGSWQARQMPKRGVPWANAVALDLYERGLLDTRYLSNYRWLEALPPVNRTFDRYYERQDYQRFSAPAAIFDDVQTLTSFLAADAQAPKRLLLFADVAPYLLPSTLITDLRTAAGRGEYSILAEGDRWLLLTVEPPAP